VTPDRDQIAAFVTALFKHADPGGFVSLRMYLDGKSETWQRNFWRHPQITGNGLNHIVDDAFALAALAAAASVAVVFAPGLATFATDQSAAERDVANGLVLAVELDERPLAGLEALENLLGPATVIVASGGQWTEPDSGEVQDRLHVYWRLREPTRDFAGHVRLREARRRMALLVGADSSGIPVCHGYRWPGTVHRKKMANPKLARIIELRTDIEVELDAAYEAIEQALKDRVGQPGAANLDGLDYSGGGIPGNARASLLDLAAAFDAIGNLDLPWPIWNRLGMALWRATGGNPEGFELFDRWSAKSAKYDALKTAKKWANFDNSPPNRLGAGTIFYVAKKANPDFEKPSDRDRREKRETQPPEEDDRGADDDDIDLEETDIGMKGGEPHVISEQEYRTREGPAKIEEQKALDRLNKRFAVVNDAGKVVVIRWQRDHMLKRPGLTRMTFDHFLKLYLNRWIEILSVKFALKGHRIYSVGFTNLAKWWLGHPDRRTFTGGLVFDPTGVKRDGFMNLWHGFGVKPAPGDWSLLRNHILLVICRGDPEQGDYFLNWLARLLQHPEEPGEVALVLRSDELGTGKSIVGRWVTLALGRHGLHITNSGQLTGRFNAHLRDLVLLFCDEAFLVGDQKAIGVLKGLCTEQTIPIEGKGANIITVKNMLHILLASNNQSVIPAALTERRFAVFEVLDTHVDDHAYFAAIEQQMQNGGLAAMLHGLLGRDISKFEVRKIPQTAGLRAQKTRSLSSLHRWWLTVLERGYLWKSRHGALWFRDWHGWYSTELLERSYGQWCDEHRISERDRKDRTQLGEFFTKLASPSRPNGAQPIHEIDSIDRREMDNRYNGAGDIVEEGKTLDEIAIAYKNRPPGYAVGSLDDARIRFTTVFPIDTEWGAYPDDE
jgi:hypothetical protein